MPYLVIGLTVTEPQDCASVGDALSASVDEALRSARAFLEEGARVISIVNLKDDPEIEQFRTGRLIPEH